MLENFAFEKLDISTLYTIESNQCPPYSCWIPVIPAESGGIWWSRIWQEGLLIFSFRCILSLAEFGHSRIETGMVPGLTGMECNQNLVVCLITVCLAFVCLAITFTPVTKHSHNTLSSHHHQPPPHHCHSSPPHVVSAHHGLNDV